MLLYKSMSKVQALGSCYICLTFLRIFSSPEGYQFVFHSTCIFVYMVCHCTGQHYYVCMYVSFICRYVAPPAECYYNTVMLRSFLIIEWGIVHFLCAMRVLEVRTSSSSPSLPLCQILFLSQLPLLR